MEDYNRGVSKFEDNIITVWKLCEKLNRKVLYYSAIFVIIDKILIIIINIAEYWNNFLLKYYEL